MAFYRFSAKVYSRSSNVAVVAKAAYRAAEKLYDERYGQFRDYTKKAGVLDKDILTPSYAPEWMHDRERLWNEVEAKEKRGDSQLAREIQVALPHELSFTERRELLRAFLQEELVSKGMVVDYAMHAPSATGDNRHFHAHVLCTMRYIEDDGFGKKAREWNDFLDHQVLQNQRIAWERHVNTALERAGLPMRVDHRSLEDQREEALQQGHREQAEKLDRVPMKKRRHAFYYMEKSHREHWRKIVERLERQAKEPGFLEPEELGKLNAGARAVVEHKEGLERVRVLRAALTKGEDVATKAMTYFEQSYASYVTRTMEIARPRFEAERATKEAELSERTAALQARERDEPHVDAPILFNLNAQRIERQKKLRNEWEQNVERERLRLREDQARFEREYGEEVLRRQAEYALRNSERFRSFLSDWEEAKEIKATYENERRSRGRENNRGGFGR